MFIDLWQDLRYALRGLGRATAVSGVTVLTIGLGIGATAVIFSLANALLLRPLPVADAARLVWVEELLEREDGGTPYRRKSFSQSRFTALRAGGTGIELAALGAGEVAFRADGAAEALFGLYTSSNYFDVLGVKPARGRFFAATEDRPAAGAPVAVISDHLWRVRLGGDPTVLGRTIYLNSQPVTIIGVAPPEFGGTLTGLANDIWLPLSLYNQLNPGYDIYAPGRMSWLEVFGRLGPGIEAAQAEVQLAAAARALPAEGFWSLPTVDVQFTQFSGLPAGVRGPVIGFVLMLQIAAGLVLLIASVNVGGVLLARAAARRHEITVRLAVGAGRGRLVRQLLTESGVLFVLGGGAGLLLAAWGTHLLAAFQPPLPMRISLDLALDPRIVAASLLIALLTGILFGLAPALEAVRPGSPAALKAGTRGSGGSGARRRTRLRNAFVTAQIALSLLLLCTAGLFIRSLQRTLAADAGFDPTGVVVATLDPEPHGYDEPRTRDLYRRLLERVEDLPGVESASLATALPLPGITAVTNVEVPGQSPPEGEASFSVEVNTIGDDYFRALRIPLSAGRTFAPTDQAGTPAVAIINEALARQFWPGESPLGRVLRHGEVDLEIVGLVRDAQDLDSGEKLRPNLYLAVAQTSATKLTLIARAPRASTGEILVGIQQVVRELDANLPLHRAGSLAGQFRLLLLPQRLAATLIGAFGVVGLLLAALGIYGVLSYHVGQRTPEIGIRLALGAPAGEVVGLVLRQGLGMVAVGLVIGLGLALAVARLITGFLHGLDPGDLLTFTGVPLLLLLVALLASWLPARRAARMDPMVALRTE